VKVSVAGIGLLAENEFEEVHVGSMAAGEQSGDDAVRDAATPLQCC
jgi:hypothetical protein